MATVDEENQSEDTRAATDTGQKAARSPLITQFRRLLQSKSPKSDEAREQDEENQAQPAIELAEPPQQQVQVPPNASHDGTPALKVSEADEPQPKIAMPSFRDRIRESHFGARAERRVGGASANNNEGITVGRLAPAPTNLHPVLPNGQPAVRANILVVGFQAEPFSYPLLLMEMSLPQKQMMPNVRRISLMGRTCQLKTSSFLEPDG